LQLVTELENKFWELLLLELDVIFELIFAQRSIKNHEPPNIKLMVAIRDKKSGRVSFLGDISLWFWG
jgi:hypothetical protein